MSAIRLISSFWGKLAWLMTLHTNQGYYELVILKFTKLSLSSEAHIVRNNTHIGEIFLFVFGNFIHV